jgi:hypothetical protein
MATAPIFIGGMIRWLVDRKLRQSPACAGLSREEFNAESDKSPGVSNPGSVTTQQKPMLLVFGLDGSATLPKPAAAPAPAAGDPH